MFWAEIWKISAFLSENFKFLIAKFSIYLNRRVFVMCCSIFLFVLRWFHVWCLFVARLYFFFGGSTSWLRHFLHIFTYTFSHLCQYEIGFLPMWETSIAHDHVTFRNNPLNSFLNPSWASPCKIGKSHPRGRNFNQGLGKPHPCWNSYPSDDALHVRMFWICALYACPKALFRLMRSRKTTAYSYVWQR